MPASQKKQLLLQAANTNHWWWTCHLGQHLQKHPTVDGPKRAVSILTDAPTELLLNWVTKGLQLKKTWCFLEAIKLLASHRSGRQPHRMGLAMPTLICKGHSQWHHSNLCVQIFKISAGTGFALENARLKDTFFFNYIIAASAAKHITSEMWQSYRALWSNPYTDYLQVVANKVCLPAKLCDTQGTDATWLLIPVLWGSCESQAMMFSPASSQRLMALLEWQLWLHVFLHSPLPHKKQWFQEHF